MKSIIYNMNTGEIVRITEERPEFKDLRNEEDCDTYEGWMELKESAEKIKQFELNQDNQKDYIGVIY